MGKILRFNEVIKVCGAENLLEEIGKDAISLWLLTGKTKPAPKTGDYPAKISVEYIQEHAPQIGVTGSGVAYDGYAEVKSKPQQSVVDDGGPAFPSPGFNFGGHATTGASVGGGGSYRHEQGMTLRDYFAAKAMQGWMASAPPDESHPAVTGLCDKLAMHSYELADAMIRARSAKP